MRIIKTNDINIVMKEMMNISACELKFIDGKEIGAPIAGYPRLPFEGGYDIIRATSGYVFVTNTTNISEIKRKLEVHKSSDKNSFTRYRRRINNGVTDVYDSEYLEFNWHFMIIDNFDFSTNYYINMVQFANIHAASIFWDTSDLCNLEHNAITFGFNKSMMRGHTNIIDFELKCVEHVDQLLIELSEKWAHYSQSFRFHNIDSAKVRRRNFQDLAFMDDDSACYYCDSKLFGDNYALAGDIRRPNNKACVAACAICVHTNKEIEKNYIAIFRVTYPKTVDSMIESADPDMIPIYRAIQKGETKIWVDGNMIILIGDEYAQMSEKCALFTNVMKNQQLIGRKILLKK